MIRHIRQIDAIIHRQPVSQDLNDRGKLQEDKFPTRQRNRQITGIDWVFTNQIAIPQLILRKCRQLMRAHVFPAAGMQNDNTVGRRIPHRWTMHAVVKFIADANSALRDFQNL